MESAVSLTASPVSIVSTIAAKIEIGTSVRSSVLGMISSRASCCSIASDGRSYAREHSKNHASTPWQLHNPKSFPATNNRSKERWQFPHSGGPAERSSQ